MNVIKYVQIHLVLKMRDGMDLAVLKFHVLQTHIIMELNVFVLHKISVGHGKYLMDKNVYIFKVNALQIQYGMVLTVILFLEIVPLVFMDQVKNVIQSLKNVYHLLLGEMIDVNRMEITVQKVLISGMVIVYLISNVKMVKHGIKT